MTWFEAVVLGLIQGLTEFLPISSSAHLLIASQMFGWEDPGAAFTAVLFTLGKLLIGLYLGVGSATSAYGAAGSLVAMILWVYYSAQILFFGAELTQAYARARGAEIEPTANAVRVSEAPSATR